MFGLTCACYKDIKNKQTTKKTAPGLNVIRCVEFHKTVAAHLWYPPSFSSSKDALNSGANSIYTITDYLKNVLTFFAEGQ